MKTGLVAIVCMALVCFGSDGRPSTALELSLTDLVSRSALIVIATASTRECRWEGGHIFTYTSFSVETAIAGQVSFGDRLVVRTLGGVIDDVGERAFGEAILPVGQTALLFLSLARRAVRPGSWSVAGMEQGSFRIVADADGKRRIAPTLRSASLVSLSGEKDRFALTGWLWRMSSCRSARFGTVMRTVGKRNLARLSVIWFASVAMQATASAWCRTTTDETFVATAAQPCAPQGMPLFWPSRCVGFNVQRDGSVAQSISFSTTEAIAGTAFANWANADCPSDPIACSTTDHTGQHPSVAGSNIGPVDCDLTEYNSASGNAHIILFHDVWPEGVGDPTTMLALTTVFYSRTTGEIHDADIAINSDPKYNAPPNGITTTDSSVAYDLASILQHETGHFLGLAHTQPPNTQAVMYSQYRMGATNKRQLAADDVCAICAAYPPNRQSICDSTPLNGLAVECGNVDGGAGGNLPRSPDGCQCDLEAGGPHSLPWASLFVLCAAWTIAARRRRG